MVGEGKDEEKLTEPTTLERANNTEDRLQF